jgi:hypothetical protein
MPDKPSSVRELAEENKTLKERLDLIEKVNKGQTDWKNINEDSLRVQKEAGRLNLQHLESQAELLARQGRMVEAAEKLKELETELTNLAKAKKDAFSAGLEVEEEIKAKREEMAGLQDKALEDAEKELSDLETKKGHLEDIDKALKNQIEKGEKYQKKMKDTVGDIDGMSKNYKKMHKAGTDAAYDIGEKMVGLVDANRTWVGSWMDAVRGMTGVEDGIGGVFAGMKEAFSLTNIAATGLTKYVESITIMIGKLDGAATAFAAATGTGNQFRGSLENVYNAGNTLGVTMEAAGAGLKGLLENQIGFASMSKGMQESLALQAGMLEKVGVDAATSADLMNTFSKTMGTTAQQSMELTKELAFMGDTIGISSKKMIKDFQNANKTLAVYGKQGIKMFTNLAGAAKAAGVEMTGLLGIAAKFDTFEDAADTVGKLNALLGANLSATEMLMMTEDQRIETMIQQVQMSGESFAQMDRFKQKAIANAVGITDMAEANRVFGMSMGEYRNYSSKMSQNELTQQKFQEAIKATLPIQEKFFAMIHEFAPRVTPLLETIHMVLDNMLSAWEGLNELAGGSFSTIVAGGAMAFVTMKAFMGVLVPLGKAYAFFNSMTSMGIVNAIKTRIMTAMGIGTKTTDTAVTNAQARAQWMLSKAQLNTAKSTVLSGQAAGASAGGMMKLGLAIVLIGAGIAVAALGLAELVGSFKGLGEAAWPAAVAVIGFTIAFGVMVYALASLTASGIAPTAAGGLLLIAAGAVLLGYAIKIAAEGMALFVGSFAGLDPTGITQTAVALVGLATAFASMAGGGLFITAGMTVVGMMAEDMKELDKAITARLENTLETLLELSTTQTIEAVNNSKAETRVEEMINLQATLTQNLNIGVKIGDKDFKTHVLEAIQSDPAAFSKARMGDVVANIVAEGSNG